MSIASVFSTTATEAKPTDGNFTAQTPDEQSKPKQVSDFITVQSLANFSVMSTAITAAWRGAQLAWAPFASNLVPLILCLIFGLISVIASTPSGRGAWLSALFIALINSLVLFSAVVGVDQAISRPGG
jgi:hypothetical protein